MCYYTYTCPSCDAEIEMETDCDFVAVPEECDCGFKLDEIKVTSKALEWFCSREVNLGDD